MDTEAFVESRSRSFSGLYRVAADYTVKNGYVVPVGNEDASEYLPMSRPELPGEFARLSGGTEEDVLRFTRRYGLPGYHGAFRFPLEVVAAHELRLCDDKVPGDPLSWVLAHADAVRLVMQLADALNSPSNLETLVDSLLIKEKGSVVLSYKAPYRGQTFPSHHTVAFKTAEEAAHATITDILNRNLEGLSRVLVHEYQTSTGRKGLTSLFDFRNLLDCIYWLVADAIVGGKVRTCGFCGKVFVAPEDRTKFCPPLLWESVSRCMNNAKQRRFQRRKREKAQAAQ